MFQGFSLVVGFSYFNSRQRLQGLVVIECLQPARQRFQQPRHLHTVEGVLVSGKVPHRSQ